MKVESITRATTPRDRKNARLTSAQLPLVEEPRHVVQQLRREWLRQLIWRLALFVGIPTSAAIVYFGFVASNQYESVAVLALESSEPSTGLRADSVLTGANSSAIGRELQALREFVLSRSMLETLVASSDLLRHFEDKRWDAISRLSARPDGEKAYAYYLKKVSADYDAGSGTLTLRVRAFEPRVAEAIASAIVATAESKLNEIADRKRAIAVRDAESQLEHAKGRVVAARADAPPSLEGGERAKLELAFAEKAFEASMSTLAELQAREIRQRPMLVTLAKPSLPDSSTYPRRIAAIGTVFVFSALALGIGSLTIAAIREHAHV